MPLYSMTGFGKSVIHSEDYHISVEIRCLNGRGLDLSLRLSRILAPLEADIRAIISEKLVRGKADAVVLLQSQNSSQAVLLNEYLLRAYIKKLKKIAQEEELLHYDVLGAALRLPDVIAETEERPSKEQEGQVYKALKEALEKLNAFREREGRNMEHAITAQMDILEAERHHIGALTLSRREALREKLLKALEAGELKTAVDENRLEQELILYLEKLDINEELVRLEAHLAHFRRTLESEIYCGRKLGFIAQEIGREINTIGSKAAHAEIQRRVTNMKDALEKIKELLLNVL
jgi:uncharacterized protein (TIGR00255 family)